MAGTDTGVRWRGEGILVEGRKVPGEDVLVRNGRIEAVMNRRHSLAGYRVRAVDGFIAPGLVDIHGHGIAGVRFEAADGDALAEAREALWRHGVAAFVASLATLPPADTQKALAALAPWQGRREPGRATLLGVHLEGPYLSTVRRGAHRADLLRRPGAAEAMALVDAHPGLVRMVTLAPELAGGLDLVRALVERGIVAALGHTDATAETMEAAFALGAHHATHLWNAMSPLGHRAPGPVGAVLAARAVTAELVCDGHHIDPRVLRLTVRTLGPRRVALVTDAMAAADLGDGEYRLGDRSVHVAGGAARLADGTLAGSTLTLDRAVKNLVAWRVTSPALGHAMASAVPARIVGAKGYGRVAPGAWADLVAVGADGSVTALAAD